MYENSENIKSVEKIFGIKGQTSHRIVSITDALFLENLTLNRKVKRVWNFNGEDLLK